MECYWCHYIIPLDGEGKPNRVAVVREMRQDVPFEDNLVQPCMQECEEFPDMYDGIERQRSMLEEISCFFKLKFLCVKPGRCEKSAVLLYRGSRLE